MASELTGMLTDRYELTMASSWLAEGQAETPAVFETFTRRLPKGRHYGVVAGTGRLIQAITRFRFDADEVGWLLDAGAVTAECADWLRDYQFRGDIIGYREGEVYFPGSPVFTVIGGLAECAVLETLILSVFNYDCAVASAGARMVDAAAGRSLIDMGSRRTHEQAALAAARAAYLVGFDSTSNLRAGHRFGIPTAGTAAHAFILSHDTEHDAFTAQVKALGADTTLLVDTYDIAAGIETAVEVAGTGLGGVRIDSGDPAVTTRAARAQLDALGARDTRIIITGDLDEFRIAELSDAPVDAFGVGTRLCTGSGHPTAELVYKLVAIGDPDHPAAPLRPVAKTSANKSSVGGRKSAYREVDPDGQFVRDHIVVSGPLSPSRFGRPLQVPLITGGEIVADPDLPAARAFHTQARNELPAHLRRIR